jgi:hypothetical protein
MFSGGWASRGEGLPQSIEGNAFEGRRAIRIVTGPDEPLQLLQDVPLNSTAYVLHVAFLLEEGTQTVRLLHDWHRGDPGGGTPAFAARITSLGITFTTPSGRWQLATAIAPSNWHALSVVADPRTGVQNVRLDGRPLIALPGVPAQPPSTIILGGTSDEAGTFRYDALELVSLIDFELATIRDTTVRLELPAGGAILDRLDAARAALERGSEALALPELGVARNILGAAGAGDDLRLALADLIELIEVSAEPREELPAAQF